MRTHNLDFVDVIEFVYRITDVEYSIKHFWNGSIIENSVIFQNIISKNWNFDVIWFVLWFRFNLTFKIFLSSNIMIMSYTIQLYIANNLINFYN